MAVFAQLLPQLPDENSYDMSNNNEITIVAYSF